MEKEQFLLFSTIFSIYLLTSGVKLHIHLLNVVVRFIVFLNSANLICRGTDISKYSRESLGLRDNESRLYLNRRVFVMSVSGPRSSTSVYASTQTNQGLRCWIAEILGITTFSLSDRNSHTNLGQIDQNLT